MDLGELTGYAERLLAGTLEFKVGLLLTAGTSHSSASLSGRR